MAQTAAKKAAKKKGLAPGARKSNAYQKKSMHRERKPIAEMPGGIQERAMLVGLTVRRFHIGRNAKEATMTVQEEFGTEAGMTKVRKNILRKDVIANLRILEAELRSEHHFLTLPWQDDGYRILSSKAYMDYTAKMRNLIEKYDAAADELVSEYEEHKADAKQRLGGLYNESEYPSAEKLRSRYVAKIQVKGLPSVEDFRVTGLDKEELAAIKEQYKTDLTESLKSAHNSVWERLKDVLDKAVERLTAYNVTADGKIENTFRDSLIGNIRDVLDVIPVLNVMDDPKLAQFAEKVRTQIAQYSGEALRDDAKLRSKVITEAEAMLKKMSEYMA